MNSANDDVTFKCPICGIIDDESINIYNDCLRKQSFKISPILPTCMKCGSEITFNRGSLNNSDSKVIALTGTCGSGKSTTAEMFMEKYGFGVIDGDCVIQVAKHKLGVEKIESNEQSIYKEIEHEIDILLALKKNIVISHIITTQDIHVYRKIFKQRKLNYKIFLLQPQYETAIERTKTRTCHKSITPEKWVKYFYDELNAFEKQNYEDVIIFNNTNYSIEESVDKILNLMQR